MTYVVGKNGHTLCYGCVCKWIHPMSWMCLSMDVMQRIICCDLFMLRYTCIR